MSTNRSNESGSLRYICLLWGLILCAVILASRLGYWYLSDPEYFPITTIKVAASYEHVTHKELEEVLAKFV